VHLTADKESLKSILLANSKIGILLEAISKQKQETKCCFQKKLGFMEIPIKCDMQH